MTGERKLWLDALRGIAMLQVIYGHIVGKVIPLWFLQPVKLPLFFAISGYLFKTENRDAKSFFSGIFYHLMVPWLAMALMYTGVKLGLDGSFDALGDYLKQIVCGDVAWFIPCCILSESVFFVLCRCTRRADVRCGLMLALAAAGLLLSPDRGEFGQMLCRSMIAMAYLMNGYLYRLAEQRLKESGKVRHWPLLFGAAYLALAVVSFMVYRKPSVNVQINQYYNPLICMAMSFSGCAFLFYYARRVHIPRYLVWIGQNTLIIYLTHSRVLFFMQRPLKWILQRLNGSVPAIFVFSLLLCALLSIICGFMSIIITRYAPVISGKWNPQKSRQRKTAAIT